MFSVKLLNYTPSCIRKSQTGSLKSLPIYIMLWTCFFSLRHESVNDILSMFSELRASLNARMINFERSICVGVHKLSGCFVVLNMAGKNSYYHVEGSLIYLVFSAFFSARFHTEEKISQKHLVSTQHWNGC